MKIGILTIHNSKNPGASLQAYALCKKIRDLQPEADIEIINYCPPYFNEFMDQKDTVKRNWKQTVKMLLVGKDLQRRVDTIKRFSAEYLPPLSERIDERKMLFGKDWGYDCVVCGSDQIWNPHNTCFDSSFFLDFLNGTKTKKVSYAASIGQDKLDERQRAFIKDNIVNMEYISIREEQGVRLAQELHPELEIVQSLDPTLLYSGTYWKNFSRKPATDLPDKYIIYYQINTSELSTEIMLKLKKKTGLKVVSPDSGLFKKKGVDKQIRDFGPQEFLWLLNNAEYIITNSFHGIILSCLMGKKVIAYKSSIRNSRIESVLKILKLEQIQVDSLDAAFSIDWDKVEYQLKNIEFNLADNRKISEEYLMRALQ